MVTPRDDKRITKPKRFLTAYNFFFMQERKAYLDTHPNDFSEKAGPSSQKTKQKHSTNIGKQGMAKHIAKKWKEISPEDKKVFNDLAKEDLARYRRELKEYQKKTRDAAWEKFKETMETSESNQPYTDNKDKDVERNSENEGKKEEKTHRKDNMSSTAHSAEEKDLFSSPPNALTNETQTESVLKPVKQASTFSEDKNREANGNREFDDFGSVANEVDAMDICTVGSFSLMSIFTETVEQENSNVFEIVYESLATRILYACDESNGHETGTGSIAVKLLTDQFPEAEKISRLQNEYKISQYLSGCGSIRPALRLVEEEGINALYLRWAEGVTLKEWMEMARGKTQDTGSTESSDWDKNPNAFDGFDIENSLYLAWEMSKAIADLHDHGVVHNNITTENVIVETDKSNGSLLVKIIDLGQASVLAGQVDKASKLQNDLSSLGAVIFEIFTGINLWQHKEYVSKSTGPDPHDKEELASVVLPERNVGVCQLNQELRSLLRSRVPLCVSTIVCNLMDGRGGVHHYQSAKEVNQDFYIILSDPGYYLHKLNDKIGTEPFNIKTNKLYGRDQEISMLVDAYNRVSQPDGVSEMVIVSGYSGAGKSALVQKIRKPVKDNDGIFLSSKFDQLKQMEPLSAIVASFSGLYNEITSRDESRLHHTRTAIQEAVGPDIGVLANIIPSLRQTIEAPVGEIIKVGGMEAQNRLKYIFRLFVRAIATPSQPLVLFLDDLHWADTASLDLIESLMTDTKNTSLLFIGSYRENEVSEVHPLNDSLRRLSSKQVPTTKIRVCNLSKEDTNVLISDLLQTTSHATQSLNTAVYRRTSGNVMFVLQFLSSLCNEGLLYFSLESKRWQWDVADIDSKNIADDAVELLSRKILQLPHETQHALKLAACLGSLCEESVLRLVVPKDDMMALKTEPNLSQWRSFCFGYADLILSLDLAVREGLMDHVDSKYKFVHDMIQFSSYHLIPEDERGRWHLWIGNQVWANRALLPEKALFVAVGQLNKGIVFINNTNQRIELARLNLQAGEKCISLAAFVPASVYLETGIVLLGRNCWLDHYDLCLRLHDFYAETKYCEGAFEEMNKTVNETLNNSRSFNDKLPSYFTLVGALLAQGHPREALNVGLSVLAQLGEPIDTSSDTETSTMLEFMRTKKMLDGKTVDDLLAIKGRNYDTKIASVRLMKVLALCAFIKTPKLYPLIVLRMVQISLFCGVCNEWVLSFAEYGFLLACIFEDVNGAYRFGRLSLHLVEKLEAKECLSQAYWSFYSAVHSGTENHHGSLGPLKHAYEVGMRNGNIYYSMMIARQYCMHLYECGEELSKVEHAFREYGDKINEHKLEIILNHTLPYRQMVLNLMGRSNDPLQLTGEAMHEDELLEYSRKGEHMHLLSSIYYHRSWLAYIFGDYELALEMAEESKVIDTSKFVPFLRSNYVFIDGLIFFALAQKTSEVKWEKLAFSAMKTMENFAKHAPSNFKHKYLLLQAESAFLSKDSKNASKYYDAAIKVAGENRFAQDQALAYERAATFHFYEGDSSLASYHYGQAHASYLGWGAYSKADHLLLHSPI